MGDRLNHRMLLGKWDRRRNQHVAPDDGRSDADDGMSRGGGFYVTQIILLFSLHARIVSVCWVCETGSSLALHRVDRRIYLGIMLNVHCLWCHGVILVYFRFFFLVRAYICNLPAYIACIHSRASRGVPYYIQYHGHAVWFSLSFRWLVCWLSHWS